MSDKKKLGGGSTGSESEFARDLALSARAYKATEADVPPPSMDDAIRAAARRAVKSKPHAVGKSWVTRWSAPISAAALLVLTVSVVLTGIDEKPELAPASLKEIALPKTPAVVTAPAAPAATESDATSGRRPAGASSSIQPAPPMEKTMPVEKQNTAPRDQLAKSSHQSSERRRDDAREAGDAAVAVDAKTIASASSVKEKRDALAESAPLPAAPAAIAPLRPLAKDAPSFAAAPPPAQLERSQERVAAAAAGPAKREVAQEKALPSALVGGAAAGSIRNEAAALADKTTEPPEGWLKRIRELKQQGKTREFEEELARFRKRYPDFALPDDLKTAK